MVVLFINDIYFYIVMLMKWSFKKWVEKKFFLKKIENSKARISLKTQTVDECDASKRNTKFHNIYDDEYLHNIFHVFI